MLKIKICGLSRVEDIQMVNELLPDYIGFVFAESKRQISEGQARKLKALLHPKIKAVGVFVNPPMEQVVRLVEDGVIDMVQLHGDEEASYCQALGQKISVPIIKAIRLKDERSLENMEGFPCDYFLFDTYVAGQYGGSGKQARTSLLQGRQPAKHYFLAGGLTSANVREALQQVNAYAVDVSGGVETNGVKDAAKVAAFIWAVRGRSEQDEQNTKGV